MKTKTLNKNQIETTDLELLNHIWDWEKEWRNSLRRVSDQELLTLFPQAKRIIPERIKELEQKRKDLVDVIKKKLQIIKEKSAPENQWYWKEVLKVWEGQDLLVLDGHIGRLKRLLCVAKGKKLKGQLTDEQIQRALAVPIENIINQPLRKSGRTLVTLCPFHREKMPSFFVYPDSNSFYCYGCGCGGNAINFVRLLYGYSFGETIKYLIGEK